MIEDFQSRLGKKMTQFIAYKRSQGRIYTARICYLKEFDEYCLSHSDPKFLTKGILEPFLDAKLEYLSSAHRSWITIFRQFGLYLHVVGENDSYIVSSKYKFKEVQKLPYCMTENEITYFFDICDEWASGNHDRFGKYLLIPAYFRLLHATGLRTFEGRWLKVSDVHLDDNFIDVMRSKDNRDRRIYLNDDLADYLKEYDRSISVFYPNREWFFPSINNTRNTATFFSSWFKIFWKKADLYKENSQNPTPYSFRHHFAITNILRWVSEGKNVEAMLPYLMRVMGHASLDSTYYYIHVIPEYFTIFSEKIKNLENRLPEVTPYED